MRAEARAPEDEALDEEVREEGGVPPVAVLGGGDGGVVEGFGAVEGGGDEGG